MDHPIQEESSSLPKVIAFTILGSNYRLYQSGTDDVGLFDTSPPSSAQTLSYPQKADGSIDKMWSGCESSVSPPQKPSSQSSLLNNSVVHSSESSEDGEFWMHSSSNHSKRICLSCGTKKSPRWHKSRYLCKRPKDNLCNACAIRIKKYHMICSNCHFAVNKEQETRGLCPRCKHKFSNMINEELLDLNSCANQLDSILASAVTDDFHVWNKQHKTLHYPHSHVYVLVHYHLNNNLQLEEIFQLLHFQ